jgi:DNA-binding GntR family transcriptional regulator
MKEILAEAQDNPAEVGLDRLSQLHTELHSLIFEMTGNSYLIAIAIPMVKRGQWLLRQSAPLRTPSAWSQHHGLISAIEAGDADLAEAVARHHVLTVRGDLLNPAPSAS